MSKIAIAGLINIESTLKIDAFPIKYEPITYADFKIKTAVSGVAYNITKALHTLGDEVNLISMTGDDKEAKQIETELLNEGLSMQYILPALKETPQSVILYDSEGKRRIYCDLKDIQTCSYNTNIANDIFETCDAAVLCNINFARGFLGIAKKLHIPIVTDVHVFSDPQDAYNHDFLNAADVLFLSDEGLPCTPKQFLHTLSEIYPMNVIVLGCGAKGAVLYDRKKGRIRSFSSATNIAPVVNTVGAGDALLSAFTHFYLQGIDPAECLRKAQIFAAIKISANGAAQGFVSEKELSRYV